MNPAPRHSMTVSVPWPVRLYGDLQDALGLPCASAALDLRTEIRCTPRSDDALVVTAEGAPDLGPRSLRDTSGWQRDLPSLAHALQAVAARGPLPDHGADVRITSAAPLRERRPDGPLFAVAWTVALLALGERLRDCSGQDVVGLAIESVLPASPPRWAPAEIRACILGGVLVCRSADAKDAAPVNREMSGMVIGWGSASSSEESPSDCPNPRAAIARLDRLLGDTPFAMASFDQVAARLRDLDPADVRVVYGHLMIRDHCRAAVDLLDGDYGLDDDVLAESLDGTQEALRDYLDIGMARLDPLMDAAAAAGALGCKKLLCGDVFLAFAPGREAVVAAAIRKAGGVAATTSVSDGMRWEEGTEAR